MKTHLLQDMMYRLKGLELAMGVCRDQSIRGHLSSRYREHREIYRQTIERTPLAQTGAEPEGKRL